MEVLGQLLQIILNLRQLLLEGSLVCSFNIQGGLVVFAVEAPDGLGLPVSSIEVDEGARALQVDARNRTSGFSAGLDLHTRPEVPVLVGKPGK